MGHIAVLCSFMVHHTSNQVFLFCRYVAIALNSKDLSLSSRAQGTIRSKTLNGNSIIFSPPYLLKQKIGIVLE